ncbi:efflux RND transporter permease subunit [Novosphingobium rosa]|uniref:efflux RND transporter permease subunit n=1 Tax=Novosphingobium rosa TaxID=76978 RepID=UPI00082D2BC8|nr:efflux RND transporter permease subunit [Novosphingobium rosa]
MLDIVKVALHRPLTFIVMAILIAMGGTLAAMNTAVDIFPEIRIPVIAVAWQYAGMPAKDMADRITTPYERVLTTTVNDIEHIESQSMQGISVVKIFFQPNADIRTANAQVTAVSQTALRQLPAGENPPLILNYNASTVPIVQLALSGKGLNEQQLFDIGMNQMRIRLITVPGLAMPYPAGGKQRQVQIDLDPSALLSKGLSANDVGNAIAAQDQLTPGGFIKIGDLQYSVRLNNAPDKIEQFNNLPIKVVNGATVYMRDVAHVRDGYPPQQNVVHVEGQRSVLMTVFKNGGESTLAIIDGVKRTLAKIKPALPADLKVMLVGDQSLFVKAAVTGVIREGLIAAGLTSLMILLFLGSWRSTIIVSTSIPLSVLAAIGTLSIFGQTLNTMTLGGLALAVGILVDEATVTIENINWHLEQGKPVIPAIIDGASQIVVPAFVSLLCICIVFVPMFFLPGVAGFLFVPMALSVVFAMIASFLLSRTLVPTMAMYLLKPHAPGGAGHEAGAENSRNVFIRFQRGFEERFEAFRKRYIGLLRSVLEVRKPFIAIFMAGVLISFVLMPFLGSNFFPDVDSGQIQMHVRLPVGTRIESSAARFELISRSIREMVPAEELTSITDNIGLPISSINTVYDNSGMIGPQDGNMLITLNEEHHQPTAKVVAMLRRELPRRFPGVSFAFLPADITSQILNFGSPAPIDVQVAGKNAEDARAYAAKLVAKMNGIAGIADLRIQQPAHSPEMTVDVNRTLIGQYGLTEKNVTDSLGTSLAGTSQVAPLFTVNPENRVSYAVVAQTPEYKVASMNDLGNVSVTGTTPGSPGQLLGGVADLHRTNTEPVVTHYDIQPTIDIFAATQGRDLGAVAGDVQHAIHQLAAEQPKTVTVTIRGQYATMKTAFSGLGFGLLGAIVLIYLLIVVNFQSWTDPLVIISALPAALAGIVWMLFITGTTLSVPALTGAIMCMGIATANSILVISFARERLHATGDSTRAALEAGFVRFRPVLMTALAMVIGMLPMALGLGDGGEQNAPLGRAVIGGLCCATIATLFFVPTLFAIAHRNYNPNEADAFPGNDPSIDQAPHHA